jgi:uroporphyrin-III C-methyltransferase
LDKQTPVAVIQNGTTPQQKMVIGTVSNIGKLVKLKKIKAPSNIIIGKVVGLSNIIGWRKNV